jgi:hypothetical protein
MSQVLEWRQRLESAHHQLHEGMTQLITNKNYQEAERRLHYVDQLMLDLIEEMGGPLSDPVHGHGPLHWVTVKNPNARAVRREAEEDLGH